MIILPVYFASRAFTRFNSIHSERATEWLDTDTASPCLQIPLSSC